MQKSGVDKKRYNELEKRFKQKRVRFAIVDGKTTIRRESALPRNPVSNKLKATLVSTNIEEKPRHECFARILFTSYLAASAKLQQPFTRTCLILMTEWEISIRKQWKIIYLPS